MTDAWEEIYRKEREIDEIRKRLSIETDIEVLASKAVERCVDISREIAKGMRGDMPEIIDFGYISEKYEKLRIDLKELSREIRRGKTSTKNILRRAGYGV